MNTMLSPTTYSLETPQRHPSLREVDSPAITGEGHEHPKVLITGDIRLCVKESEVTLHPVIGQYSIQTTGMREPLYTLWHAEGQVIFLHGRSASIAFDVRGARAGEIQTYLVAVQVGESDMQGRVVLSGVFVQVVVTSDESEAT